MPRLTLFSVTQKHWNNEKHKAVSYLDPEKMFDSIKQPYIFPALKGSILEWIRLAG